MAIQQVLIDGTWRDSDCIETFRAVNPREKSALPQDFPVSSRAEMEEAVAAGYDASRALRSVPHERLADFLKQFARNIETRADELVDAAHLETALPREPRLRNVELPRTTDQLRKAARAVRDRSWTEATIDTATGIRSMFGPIGGPVAVFGPNNFPFAFNSVAGGDFAAALAAGNPVIAKANTGHPETTRLLALAAFDAIQANSLPPALVQLIYRLKPEDGLRLVSHPRIGATGFTGSRDAGLRLKTAADAAGRPIYLEMSSINPVFVLPGALEERLDELVAEFFSSCTLGGGQFCTNPGMVVLIDDASGRLFIEEAARKFSSETPGTLLGEKSPGQIAEAVETLTASGATVVTGGAIADGPGYSYRNTILSVPGKVFLERPVELQTEAFGAVSTVVLAGDADELCAIAAHLEGNLTGCIYSHTEGADDALYSQLEPELRTRVGRLLNDKMPTGVAVSPAMNHGGPYPATGHPGFTAVGIPASIRRFGALYSYDNVREQRLPPELRDRNPTGDMWRLVDGAWSQVDIVAS